VSIYGDDKSPTGAAGLNLPITGEHRLDRNRAIALTDPKILNKKPMLKSMGAKSDVVASEGFYFALCLWRISTTRSGFRFGGLVSPESIEPKAAAARQTMTAQARKRDCIASIF